MNAHVFVVDDTTFTVHSKFQFCGVVNPARVTEQYGVYADLMTIRENDLVFFYQRYSPQTEAIGFHGIYEAKGKPFFDTTEVIDSATGKAVKGKCSCGYPHSAKRENQFSEAKCLKCGATIDYPILPNRIKIQTKEFYERSVQDNTAYVDHRDYGTMWTMLFRKVTGAGRARSVMHLLPEETDKLTRLIRTVNENKQSPATFTPYPANSSNEIKLDVAGNSNSDGSVTQESILHAWVMQNIDKNKPSLKKIVGSLDELEYFGAWIPYSVGTETVDVLLLHKRDGARYKATVIELKKDKINQSAVDQARYYAPWIAQLVTENAEPEINGIEIQPVTIGFGKTRSVTLPKPHTFKTKYYSSSRSGNRNEKKITINEPKVFSYKVNGQGIDFTAL